MSKITIARALVELKSLIGRIERSSQLPIVGVILGEGDTRTSHDPAFSSAEDAITQFGSNFNRTKDLIARREAVKRAVVKANAETVVEIAGLQLSLAEAIEMKKFVSVRKSYLERVRLQLRSASANVSTLRTALNDRIDAYRREQNDNSNQALVESTVSDMRSRGVPNLESPVDLGEYLAAELEKIAVFEQEVDVTLNEVNAITEIEVSVPAVTA